MARSAKFVLTTMAFFLLGTCNTTPAQDAYCDAAELLRSKSIASDRYAPRDGNYCDGRIFVPHGGRLEIISIQYGSNDSNVGEPQLSVNRPRQPNGQNLDWPVLLKGLTLPGTKVDYRLDAHLSADHAKLVLDANSAFAKLSLHLSDIGWLAWTTKTNHERVYLPVNLSSSPRGNLLVVVQPATDTSSVTLTMSGPAISHEIQQERGHGGVAGIPLTFTIDSVPEGLIDCRIVSESPSGITESTDILLFL